MSTSPAYSTEAALGNGGNEVQSEQDGQMKRRIEERRRSGMREGRRVDEAKKKRRWLRKLRILLICDSLKKTLYRKKGFVC